MATIHDIVKEISQIVANTRHGATNEEGELVKIGLRREEPTPITQRGLIDGFGIQFNGDRLKVNYHSEIHLKEVHHKDFETTIAQTIADVASFIGKEYKGATGEVLRLEKIGEADVRVQTISRLRSWVQATCTYRIGNLDGESSAAPNTRETREDVQKFLDLGGNK